MEGNKRIRMPLPRPLLLRPSKKQVFVMPRELDFGYPLVGVPFHLEGVQGWSDV